MRDAGVPHREREVLCLRWGVRDVLHQKLEENSTRSAEDCAEQLKMTVKEVHAIEKFSAWRLFLYLAEGITWEKKRVKRNWFTAFIATLARPLVRSLRVGTIGPWLADLQFEDRISEEEVSVLEQRWTLGICGHQKNYNESKMLSLAELNHNLVSLNKWYGWRQEPNKYHYPAPVAVFEKMELKAIYLLLEKLITGRKTNRPLGLRKLEFGPIRFVFMEGRFTHDPYLVDVAKAVKSNWSWTETLGEEKVLIRFKLNDSGTIEEISIAQSSSNNELDKSAVEAIEKSNPLPSFPRFTTAPQLEAEFTFDRYFYQYLQTDDLSVYIKPAPDYNDS